VGRVCGCGVDAELDGSASRSGGGRVNQAGSFSSQSSVGGSVFTGAEALAQRAVIESVGARERGQTRTVWRGA
jgi:hypothetical protein